MLFPYKATLALCYTPPEKIKDIWKSIKEKYLAKPLPAEAQERLQEDGMQEEEEEGRDHDFDEEEEGSEDMEIEDPFAEHRDGLDAFICYIENNWVGRIVWNERQKRAHEQKPTWDPVTWNKHEDVQDLDVQLCNNYAESFNSAWNKFLNGSSLNIWTLIDNIKLYECHLHKQVQDAAQGVWNIHNQQNNRKRKRDSENKRLDRARLAQ